MPKVNIYLPEDLAEAVKDAGVPVSAVCQRALEQAVRRVTAIREIASGRPAALGTADPPVINFTRRAMAVLQAAQTAAAAAGQAEVGTGQVLGALVAGDNMAVRVLGALEITPRQVRSGLAAHGEPPDAGRPEVPSGGGPSGGGPSGGGTVAVAAAGLGRQAAAALVAAAAESSGLGNAYVGCEHLLLGLISEPEGAGGSVLRALGADLRVTRRTVAAALAGWGAGVAAQQQSAAAAASHPAGPAAAGPEERAASAWVSEHLPAAVQAQLAPVLARIERLEQLTSS